MEPNLPRQPPGPSSRKRAYLSSGEADPTAKLQEKKKLPSLSGEKAGIEPYKKKRNKLDHTPL